MRVRLQQGRFLLGGVAICCAWLLASCASHADDIGVERLTVHGGPLKKIAIIVVNKGTMSPDAWWRMRPPAASPEVRRSRAELHSQRSS
jgi:hypothetical protein